MNLTFVLSRSPEVQAQFEQLLRDQQDPGSAHYHQWLTPQQVGEQYGPTQHDLDALSEWLGSQGLSVREVAPSGMFVSASGTASSVAAALATDFHYFERNGGLRISATAEPAIPSALAPVVASISGLAEAEIHPSAHMGEIRSMTGAGVDSGVHPEATFNGYHFITPGDFATIFDLTPVYSAGYNGAGQKVAIIGRSRVAATDITAYESKTGLTTSVPNIVIPTSGVDPGTTGDGDQIEATVDVERVIGVAPRAQVDLVVSRSSGNSDGLSIAAQYEVQTLRDPVMNISFGGCEGYGGASSVALWDALFSQAASEGISVFVSSGDSGAAGCDAGGELAPAYQFLSINDICSSSFATCVGGTELMDFNNPLQYWSSTNSSTLASALGYIPEGGWNESGSYNYSIGGYPVLAGGGGASIYVAKPSWQTGTGVPADHARDVPDVSFPGAGHDGYFTCVAFAGGDCSSSYFLVISGTSNAAPSMAGVAAILNQKMGGAQGNLNPILYQIAASTPNAFHDATPASAVGNSCLLYNVSACNNSTPASTTIFLMVGLQGYALTTGYDQVTGLGSLDVANFLTAAASASHQGVAATTLAVHGSATTITNTQTATFTATVSSNTPGLPTGTVQFYTNGNALGTPVTVSSGTATTTPLPFTAAGTYYITAMYSGDSNFAASTAPGFSLAVTGFTSSTTVTISTTPILVGTKATFSASVTGSSGSPMPTGNVRFLVIGSNYGSYVATVPLANGTATTPLISFPTVGSYTVTAQYLGDAVYSASNSAPLLYTVNKQQSFVQLSSTGSSIGTSGGSMYGIYVGGALSSSGASVAAPTGTVQLYSNGTALGSPVTLPSQGGQTFSPTEIFSTAGTFAITAVYSGDANWLPSTASAIPQTVLSQPATFQMTHTTPTLSFTAGATASNTDLITVTGNLGFTGAVNLTCTVAYNGAGTANNSPTCSMTKPQSVLSPDSTNYFQSSVTINTTARPVTSASGRGPRSEWDWSHPGAIGLCAVMLWFVPIRRRSWRGLTAAVVMFAGLIALSGCGGSGGGGSSTPPAPVGTTAGSYTVTIAATTTATGIAAPAPLTIALTIN